MVVIAEVDTRIGTFWWLVYRGCLNFRSRAFRTCSCSKSWEMTCVMPPERSTELTTFGGLVMYSLSEKMLAPGKDTGCLCQERDTFWRPWKELHPFYPFPPEHCGGGGGDKSIGERSVYRGEHIYFIHVVLNLFLKRWICWFRYFRRESVFLSQAHLHTLNDWGNWHLTAASQRSLTTQARSQRQMQQI